MVKGTVWSFMWISSLQTCWHHLVPKSYSYNKGSNHSLVFGPISPLYILSLGPSASLHPRKSLHLFALLSAPQCPAAIFPSSWSWPHFVLYPESLCTVLYTDKEETTCVWTVSTSPWVDCSHFFFEEQQWQQRTSSLPFTCPVCFTLEPPSSYWRILCPPFFPWHLLGTHTRAGAHLKHWCIEIENLCIIIR